jgi:energy-coupling factor transport system substrate-specific component
MTTAAYAALAATLLVGFAWYERQHPSNHVVALVATLAALAVLGRVAFAPLPNVKPTLAIVFLAGYALGGAPAFVVGATAALVSNFFFGQGPWTPWQMVAFGLVGVLGAVFATVTRRRAGRLPLAVACGVAGYACGLLLDVGTWLNFGGGQTGQLGFTVARGIPFDIALAAGDIAFTLAFGPALVAALTRYRTRFEVVWHPAGTPLAGALIALALVAPPPAHAAGAQTTAEALSRSVAYLESARNADGGFGASKSDRSTQLHTAWAAMGLAAARRAPAPATLAYLNKGTPKLTDNGDLERAALALRAANGSARAPVAKLLRRRAKDGSIEHLANRTAFLILALRAAGRSASDPAIRKAASWLVGQENRDGGWSFAGKGGQSGIDDTAAVVQALAAAHRPRTGAIRRGASFIASKQSLDGGFPLTPGDPSNAQSTAWAIQALLAAGREPETVKRKGSRSPLGYLRSLVAADGSVRYSRTSRQSPVWVTAQALTALARKPFPIDPVPARKPARKAAAPAPKPQPKPRAKPRRAAPARQAPQDVSAQATLAGVACATVLGLAGMD